MDADVAGGFILLSIIALGYLAPILIILFSSRTRGSEKLGWILAVIFISWLAFIIYLIAAPFRKREYY